MADEPTMMQMLIQQHAEFRAELAEHRKVHTGMVHGLGEQARSTARLSIQIEHLNETLKANAQIEKRVSTLERQLDRVYTWVSAIVVGSLFVAWMIERIWG